jgi:FixJ family two-component response regulator
MARGAGGQGRSRGSGGRLVKPRPLIAVVDDDESVRESLPDLLRELGYEARAFASAKEFLDSGCLGEADCLILDIAMPDMSGPELQLDLIRKGEKVPIIFITAHGDKGIRATLRKKGAVEVLFKPYSEQDLRAALGLALPAP